MSKLDLTGHRVLITGAGQGIGRGIAETFANWGARVAAADVSEESLMQTCKILSVSSPESFGLRLDVTDEGSVDARLEQGGAHTEAGRNSRAYAIRTIERNLSELGIPYRDLENAWVADRFVALRERLKQMRVDARAGGQDCRLLMPDSDNYHIPPVFPEVSTGWSKRAAKSGLQSISGATPARLWESMFVNHPPHLLSAPALSLQGGP